MHTQTFPRFFSFSLLLNVLLLNACSVTNQPAADTVPVISKVTLLHPRPPRATTVTTPTGTARTFAVTPTEGISEKQITASSNSGGINPVLTLDPNSSKTAKAKKATKDDAVAAITYQPLDSKPAAPTPATPAVKAEVTTPAGTSGMTYQPLDSKPAAAATTATPAVKAEVTTPAGTSGMTYQPLDNKPVASTPATPAVKAEVTTPAGTSGMTYQPLDSKAPETTPTKAAETVAATSPAATNSTPPASTPQQIATAPQTVIEKTEKTTTTSNKANLKLTDAEKSAAEKTVSELIAQKEIEPLAQYINQNENDFARYPYVIRVKAELDVRCRALDKRLANNASERTNKAQIKEWQKSCPETMAKWVKV